MKFFISLRWTTASSMPCSSRNSRALEAFGQLLPDGLLDDARAGEADERARLGDVQVAQHREAGGDAAGGRIGEHGDVGNAASSSRASAAEILAICMRRGDAFHHARAARGGDDDQRLALLGGALDGAGDGLAHDRAHAAADEGILHRAHDHVASVELAFGVDDGVLQSGRGLGLAQAVFIGAACQ